MIVNGTAGFGVAPHGQLRSIASFTIVHGKIVFVLADPARLDRLDPAAHGG